MTNVSRSTGSKRVREAFSAQAALADRSSKPPPPDAFERRFWQRSRHRDATVPASQSRPWVLWFLIIALSGSVIGTIFWSDTSISRDSSRQVVGSDPAWRGVIRQTRPTSLETSRASANSNGVTPQPSSAGTDSQTLDPSADLIASPASSAPPVKQQPLAKVAPVAKIAAAYASTIESARELAGKAGLVTETDADERAPAPASASRTADVAGVNTPVVAAAAATPSPDRLGDPTVLAIQGLLSKNGFAPGPADGLMGTRTRTAILAWQLQQGLPTTGRADKTVLEQLLDPQKARTAADRLPISVLAQPERDALETWCTAGRNAGNLVAYYECMGSEVAKLSTGLRMPELRQEASGNLDAFATARLLCTDQASAAPQVYFQCLHNELSQDKPLFVME